MTDDKILPEAYQALSEERAESIRNMTKTSEEEVLEEFNAKYALVHTNSTYILMEKKGKIVLDTRASFLQLHENDFFTDSKQKSQNKAKFWLKHENRRIFSDIVFNPSRPGHYPDNQGGFVYNIFSGFAFSPKPGDCSLFWTHVFEVVCNGDIQAYSYVRKWMACVVQHPRVLATALVLRGAQGTGKTLFVSLFGELFGRYFLTVNNLDQIVGRFNSHLQYTYLLNANEAIWGGHKKEVGALKAIVTDSTIFIEGKGKDGFTIDNCRHLIVTSNESWAVPRDLDDRRFFVLDVSDKRKGDTPYFQSLIQQMNGDGCAALLYDLLHEGLTGFDPRIMPTNGIGFDMKMLSASSSERYIFEALRLGAWNLASLEGGWVFYLEKAKGDIFDFYREWCKKEGLRHQTNSELGEVLKKLIPSCGSPRPTIEGKRTYCYSFPSLEVCRREFQTFVKEPDSIWVV